MSETATTPNADTGTLPLVERAAGLTAGIGAFMMVSPAVFTITGWMGIHNVLLGAAIALVASVHALRTEQHVPSLVLAAMLVLLGLWAIAAPFALGVNRELVIWLNVAAGALVAILSAVGVYGTLQTSRSTEPSDATGA